jgi:hypothetical protein
VKFTEAAQLGSIEKLPTFTDNDSLSQLTLNAIITDTVGYTAAERAAAQVAYDTIVARNKPAQDTLISQVPATYDSVSMAALNNPVKFTEAVQLGSIEKLPTFTDNDSLSQLTLNAIITDTVGYTAAERAAAQVAYDTIVARNKPAQDTLISQVPSTYDSVSMAALNNPVKFTEAVQLSSIEKLPTFTDNDSLSQLTLNAIITDTVGYTAAERAAAQVAYDTIVARNKPAQDTLISQVPATYDSVAMAALNNPVKFTEAAQLGSIKKLGDSSYKENDSLSMLTLGAIVADTSGYTEEERSVAQDALDTIKARKSATQVYNDVIPADADYAWYVNAARNKPLINTMRVQNIAITRLADEENESNDHLSKITLNAIIDDSTFYRVAFGDTLVIVTARAALERINLRNTQNIVIVDTIASKDHPSLCKIIMNNEVGKSYTNRVRIEAIDLLASEDYERNDSLSLNLIIWMLDHQEAYSADIIEALERVRPIIEQRLASVGFKEVRAYMNAGAKVIKILSTQMYAFRLDVPSRVILVDGIGHVVFVGKADNDLMFSPPGYFKEGAQKVYYLVIQPLANSALSDVKVDAIGNKDLRSVLTVDIDTMKARKAASAPSAIVIPASTPSTIVSANHQEFVKGGIDLSLGSRAATTTVRRRFCPMTFTVASVERTTVHTYLDSLGIN